MTVLAAMACEAGPVFAQEENNTSGSTAVSQTSEMPFVLLQIQADIWGNLTDIDAAVAGASYSLSAAGLEEDESGAVLKGLIDSNPVLIEASTFDRDGKILASGSDDYNGSEGADISGQKAVARLLETRNPVMSDPFQTVEGFEAIALIYPVFSQSGEFIGGVSATLDPGELFRALVSPRLSDPKYSFWMMGADGLIVYDQDASQIGKMLFDDPLYQPYQSLLDLGRVMAGERSGHGSYSFQVTESNQSVVTKDTYWTTFGLHGTEWRLVLTRIED